MTERTPAREATITVVCPTEVAAGYRLAGATVRAAADAAEGAEALRALLAEGARGVIAVYAPFFDAMAGPERIRAEASVSPVVVALPTGIGAEPEGARRARLTSLLQRAIGYHIEFGEQG